MVASWVIGGVLLLAMLAASGRAAAVLPADARIAIHCGSVEHCYLVSKRAGLVIWPAVGAVLFGALGGITQVVADEGGGADHVAVEPARQVVVPRQRRHE